MNMLHGKLNIYRASAGSGKTFTLAAEYISLLLAGDASSFKQILAVTFTNKATMEMKERILQCLYDIAHPAYDETGKPLPDALFEKVKCNLPTITEEKLRQRANESLRAIVHDYDHFRVETIDSFFQSLLSNLAHELGLMANFKIGIEDREVIDKAVDELMTHLADRKDVRRWILNYIRQRIDDNRRWDISFEVKKLANHLLDEKYLLFSDRLQPILQNNEVLQTYKAVLKEQEEMALDKLQSAALHLKESILDREGDFGNFSNGRHLKSFLDGLLLKGKLDAPGASVLKYSADAENWLKKTDLKNAELLGFAEKMRNILNEYLDFLEKERPVIFSSQLTTELLQPLRLLNEINRIMEDINRENNRFMLARTPLLFEQLVEEQDTQFVFEKAGTQFQHIMIDEFQDTSTLQWNNFKKLLIENLSTGNSCLLVGDIKQSIYRWRNGDWRILGNIENEFPPSQIVLQDLSMNFRSGENIITFNNRFFQRSAAILTERDVKEHFPLNAIYDGVCQEVPTPNGKGYVRFSIGDGKTWMHSDSADDDLDYPEVLLDDMAQQIIALHTDGLPYKEMAILVRTNQQSKDILTFFADRYPEIPLVSDEAFLLNASPAVELLIQAFRYLCDTTNSIARAYLLSHYQNSILGNSYSWNELLAGGDTLLPEEFSTQLPLLSEMPLFELCERLIRIFRLEKMQGQGSYLFCFLDQVLIFLEDNPSRLTDFLTFWDEVLHRKAIPSATPNGVRILTIHKSKGLAFHTVLLPDCTWPIEENRRGTLLWCEPSEVPYNALPLVPIPLKKEMQDSVYRNDYEEEHRQQRVENLNLLYVAFTRTKMNLFVWATGKKDVATDKTYTTGDLMADFFSEESELPFVAVEGQPVCTLSRKAEMPPSRNPLDLHPQPEEIVWQSYPASVEFRQSNLSKDFLQTETDAEERRQEEYIHRGKLLHKLFSMIHTSDDVDDALATLQSQGYIGAEINTDSLRTFIRQRITSSVTKEWFEPSWKIFNECSILSRDADGKLRERRPDRVMMREGETIVIDFKFGKPHPVYHEQVAEYKDLLSRMGHSSVKGYIWYVFDQKIETV